MTNTSVVDQYSQPLGDTSNYIFATPGSTNVAASDVDIGYNHAVNSFTILWGSPDKNAPDTYNLITLSNGDKITGGQILRPDRHGFGRQRRHPLVGDFGHHPVHRLDGERSWNCVRVRPELREQRSGVVDLGDDADRLCGPRLRRAADGQEEPLFHLLRLTRDNQERGQATSGGLSGNWEAPGFPGPLFWFPSSARRRRG